ncbi:MAG: glycosyltransferase family 39 protein [Candidatus Methylomirabilia bacterium]
MSGGAKAGLLGLLILGALLRFGGMSHDLHEGRIYHPDTPKQISAVQGFSKGRYFQHIGRRTFDGYPLFHAHLVEYIVRVVEPLRRGVLELVGVPSEKNATLDTTVLYWILLSLNAALSTATILLVFKAGREHFSPGVGWVAAGLQTVSPIDVTAAHMATGDATAAFFAALSLFFALRIASRGFTRDYVAAAAIGSCAFAAKYYAALAFFPILAAHLARTGRPGAWFGAASLRRMAVVAAAAVAGLFLAIPSLFGHFVAQMKDILAVMANAGQRAPDELGADPSRWTIFLYGQRTNLPVLVRLLSPAAVMVVLVGFATRVRRDPRFWILLVGPVAYWVFGVGSRAQVHPVFHAVITAPLFLLTAACAGELWRGHLRWSRALRPLAAVLVAGAIVVLAEDALRELFFQWHMDARRLGAAWVAENVPRSFRVNKTRYTFDWEGDDSLESGPAGSLYVRSAVGELPAPPATAIPLKSFALERDPLTIFRNIRQEAYVDAPALIRRGFSLPVSQRYPSQTGNQVVFDNGRDFLRSGKLFALNPGDRVERWLVSATPLREAWVVAQVAAAPAGVSVSFGKESRRLEIAADASAWFHVAKPRPQFPSAGDLLYYRLGVDKPTAQVRVLVATRPGEAGRMLYGAGRYADAAPLLARGALEEDDPAAAAMAEIAARIAAAGAAPATAAVSELAARALSVTDDDSLFAAYGIRAAYLDALPFLSLPAKKLGGTGFRLKTLRLVDRDAEVWELAALPRLHDREREKGFRVWTADLMLDPGHYRARVALRALRSQPGGGQLRAVLVDVRETLTLAERDLENPALDTRGYTFAGVDLVVPPGSGAVRLYVKADQPPDLAVGGMEIHPAPLANARALATTLQALLSGDCSIAAREPLAYDALQALGAQHAGQGALESAAGCYAAAAALFPGRAGPLEALKRLLPALAVDRQAYFNGVIAKLAAAR